MNRKTRGEGARGLEYISLSNTGHRLAVLSNGALKFSRVTLGDAGTYQCLAQNEAGTAVGRTKLILQGKHTFLII